ncbi:hypothetical protein V500_08300 [Pseudogymnoascus sp. VKM F-4518 (FW-2643)]|nr:hypothetical protein V500_08300 [Pseudogymnoascus sp. VKM F-4518 (FW-2643)]
MKTKVFVVFSALAATSIAAPQHHQTSLNRVSQSPATIFEDPCWRYSNNKGTASYPCWTCCRAPENTAETLSISSTPVKEEIDISIKISDTSVTESASALVEDFCWRYSNNKGTASHPCWTCCKAPTINDAADDYINPTASEEDIEVDIQISDTAPAVSTSSIFQDPCSAAHPCWTCCRAPDVVDASASSEEDMESDMDADMELEMEADMEADVLTSDLTLTCYGRWARRPRCPRGWYAERRLGYWRCCRNRRAAPSIDSAPDNQDITIDIQIDTTTASPASLFEDPCWRYSNNKGTASHPCWTCCKAPTDNAATSHLLGLPADL